MLYSIWFRDFVSTLVSLEEVIEGTGKCSTVFAVLAQRWDGSNKSKETFESLANPSTQNLVRSITQNKEHIDPLPLDGERNVMDFPAVVPPSDWSPYFDDMLSNVQFDMMNLLEDIFHGHSDF